MESITLGQLLDAVQGTLLGEKLPLDTGISQVETDSRTIHPGSLFIPLVGEKFDGHTYLQGALESGAVGCLTDRELDHYLPGKFYVKVEHTERALGHLASWYKSQFSIPFIGITGSVGKTTTKDMVAAVLSTKYKVLKTEGNFNNNVGLPMTLLRLDPTHQICVLEMGMDCFGEIDYLGGLVQPDVGVITNIGDAHIERLGSRENIFKAKCELLPHVKKDGLLILNGDDQYLSALRGNTPVETMFCGKAESNEYSAAACGGDKLSYITCQMNTPYMAREVRIPALGEHMIYPSLIAAAVGERYGLTADNIAEGLRRFVPTRMRMNLLQRQDNITILDDTYNANPQSMRAAISVLADSGTNWNIAVLGDMLELGSFAPALHREIGEYLGKTGVHCLVTVGELGEYIAQGAEEGGVPSVYRCKDKAEANAVLTNLLRPNCTILLKASRGMRMEEVTAHLLTLTAEKTDK